MTRGWIDQSYLEDLSDYLVSVSVKRPHFHREMQSKVLDCEFRYIEGDQLAVHDALLHCERGSLPLPLWLSHAVRECVVSSLTGGFSGTRGRSNSLLGHAQKELRQQVHYRTVHRIREISIGLSGERLVASIFRQNSKPMDRKLAEEISKFRDYARLPSHQFPRNWWAKIYDKDCSVELRDFEASAGKSVLSLSQAYETASKILRGTFAQAEPRTIRKSFKDITKMVEQDEDGRKRMLRWFSEADPSTLDALGLNIEMDDIEMSAWEMGQDILDPEVGEYFGVEGDSLFIEIPDPYKVAK
ncbi:hypothetical protein [Marivita sp. XM-24bin2]|uniref:hypothetical protein n=1 Tax=unclassified Marivita TaxID=2632480 RepID=UPI0025BB4806|nr:hypothetical protein [Marivita sp. XM-24bin2]MCR9109696.1 hypothetical protein [Paracoccaceae bacterium]